MSSLRSLVARVVTHGQNWQNCFFVSFNWDIQTHKDGNIIWVSFVYSRANNLESMENI